ncbi:GNAT family N-acetyltransferase [Monashia sp. NPDC004114]
MSDLRTRDVTEADLPAILTVRNRSFGPLRTDEQTWWRQVADETLGGRWLVVVDESDVIVGAGRVRPYEQAWGGRFLPMGGVAGVYVEPAARGRGVATLLTGALIERMGELGDVVSCLFPTTTSLYRRSGFEVGGVQTRTTYAAALLRDLARSSSGLALRAAGSKDAERLHAMAREGQVRHTQSGPMVPSEAALRSMLERADLTCYIVEGSGDGADADAGGAPDAGFVVYDLSDEVVTVEHLVADTPESALALWGVVASGSSAAPTVHTYLDPRDPVALLLPGLPAVEVRQMPWMARVIDLAEAVAGRGFAPGLTASADLVVSDPEAAGNSGWWRFSVDRGWGTAELLDPEAAAMETAVTTASGTTVARVGARGLAALWCGWTTSRLRQAGLVVGGDPDADAALDAIFACTPHLTEYF